MTQQKAILSTRSHGAKTAMGGVAREGEGGGGLEEGGGVQKSARKGRR